MPDLTNLQAISQDRKSRIAHLRSLQRKQEPKQDHKRKSSSRSPPPPPKAKKSYLSGRNYDTDTQGPKLGFDHQPGASQTTLESQANALAIDSKKEQEEEAQKTEEGVDLFKLQPKVSVWDAKQTLGPRLEVLRVRTDNAFARLLRDEFQRRQKEGVAANGSASNGDTQEGEHGEDGGIDGNTLVESARRLEHEDAQTSDEPEEDVG